MLALICFPFLALMLAVVVLGTVLMRMGILHAKTLPNPPTPAEEAVICWLLSCVIYLSVEWCLKAWWKIKNQA